MRSDVNNILLVGVGGQGVLLASELLSDAAFKSGLDVKKSEVHGMAQRGGVVSSHVRFGKKVYSPLIPMGECDVMLAIGARFDDRVQEKSASSPPKPKSFISISNLPRLIRTFWWISPSWAMRKKSCMTCYPTPNPFRSNHGASG